jgi:hypothetical protein
MAAICSSCPVRRACAAYALSSPDLMGFYAGVWIRGAKGGAGRHAAMEWALEKLQQVANGAVA